MVAEYSLLGNAYSITTDIKVVEPTLWRTFKALSLRRIVRISLKDIVAPTIETVAVIGAGTMGHGIAQVAAGAGYPVILRDVDLDSLHAV